MIELTEQQRQELGDPEPVAIDPQTGQTYVLVRRETYEQLTTFLPQTGQTYVLVRRETYEQLKTSLDRPQPSSKDEFNRQARERIGVSDSDFQRAAEIVFTQHEELLRRLA